MNLKQLLKENKITQREAANMLNLSERTIRRHIENPSKHIVLAIERAIQLRDSIK